MLAESTNILIIPRMQLVNTLTDLVRIGAFIPRDVIGCYDEEIRRVQLKSCSCVAGRIARDRRDGSSIGA